MSESKNVGAVSFVFFLCILISLSFVDTAHALKIVGSNQMPVNSQQQFTATDGEGSLSWAVASGGGSITGDGTYTAPGSNNATCSNNAKVCVTDSSGQQDCITIGVNQYTNSYDAYVTYSNIEERCEQTWFYSYWRCEYGLYYTANYFNCDGTLRRTLDSAVCDASVGCDYAGPNCANLKANHDSCCNNNYGGDCNNYLLPNPKDLRNASLLSGGCCPGALAVGAGGGNPGPNDTGRSCPISREMGSSSNLKSGNLYHSQDVGILTLSYNSIDTINGVLGKKWTHQYNQQLTASSATIALKTEDGNIIYYRLSGGVYYPENISGDTSQIVKYTNNTYGRTTKSGTIYNYNTSGQLTSIVDRNGNTTTLTYTGGYLASITDQNGRTTTITTTSGLITGVTDAMSRTYALSYTNGLLTSVTPPLGNSWTYTYDAAGQMLTKTDPSNFTVTYTYANGKIQSSTDPESLTRSMNYVQSGETRFTEKDNSVWIYTYDPVYAVKTAKTDPLGNITRYTYDLKRNLTKTTYPDGTYTSYTYDAASNMTSMTDPLGNVTLYTYNSLNLVATISDPKGGVTTYTYDTMGNPLTIADPSGTTTFQYDARGNVTAIIDARSKTTTFTYDTQNNLLTVTDQTSKTTTFTYDAVGNRLTATDPLGHSTSYVYNTLNQMIQVTDPRNFSTYYTYDYKGNILTATDAKSNPTTYAYNYRGNLTQITDALNSITHMTYGPAGCGSGCSGADKLTALTDALNHITGYTYDAAGRLTHETDPQGKVTTYTYDTKGQMLTKTKPDGRTITYTYNAAGRLTGRLYSDNSSDSFQYDANGNILIAANQYITYNYTYNASNRVAGVTDSNGRSITYQYDQLGNKTTMITPDNLTTTYAYDDASRLTSVSNYVGIFTLYYDNDGRRYQLVYPNGATATYSYDESNNLLNVTHSAGYTIAQAIYTYDQINNRLTRTDTQSSFTYGYDAVNRLLTSTPGEVYTYDAVGNRLTGLPTDAAEGATITDYTYDDENRLIQVIKTDGTVITYAYDPFGRRIGKNVNGTITTYVYDNEDIVMEYDGSGYIKTKYTHGLGIDEPLAMQQNANTYYYHADGLGSIVALTNGSGSKVQSYAYDSFGRITISGSIVQPYTFTAREYDTETGLYFYRARYYDPKAGRFITKDPIGFNGGDVNLYAYVGNNPVNWVDPSGKIALIDDATILALLVTTMTVAYLESPQGQAMLAQNTKHVIDVIKGLLENAQHHADKCSSASPNDPNQDHWRDEIKAALDRAKRLAEKRLNGKARDAVLRAIDQIKGVI